MIVKRHFVVHITDGVYSIKEINPDVAESIARYGVAMIEHTSSSDACCIFYFMNVNFVSDQQRHTLVEHLATLVPNDQ